MSTTPTSTPEGRLLRHYARAVEALVRALDELPDEVRALFDGRVYRELQEVAELTELHLTDPLRPAPDPHAIAPPADNP